MADIESDRYPSVSKWIGDIPDDSQEVFRILFNRLDEKRRDRLNQIYTECLDKKSQIIQVEKIISTKESKLKKINRTDIEKEEHLLVERRLRSLLGWEK